MSGQVFGAGKVVKNLKENRFEELSTQVIDNNCSALFLPLTSGSKVWLKFASNPAISSCNRASCLRISMIFKTIRNCRNEKKYYPVSICKQTQWCASGA
jgi:hypothetical protein